MNKDEILKYLDYHGEYTKDVKKRLKKLLKKYHPDNNSRDKDTILILYEIKKQLEKGTLKNYNSLNKKDSDTPKNNSEFTANEKKYTSFFENMISILQKKKEEINKKINSLYKKLNEQTTIKNKVQNELGKTEFDVEELQAKLKKITGASILDKIFIVLIIILWICSIIFKKIFLLISSVVFIVLEIYYIYIYKIF